MVLVDRLVADFEPSHRSVYPAETSHHPLVIGESELANSSPNVLGPIFGHCGQPYNPTVHANALKRFGLRALIMLANQQVVAGTRFACTQADRATRPGESEAGTGGDLSRVVRHVDLRWTG